MFSIKFLRRNGDIVVIPFPKGYSVSHVSEPRSESCPNFVAKYIYQEDGTAIHHDVLIGATEDDEIMLKKDKPDSYYAAYVQNENGKTVDVIVG